MRDVYRVVLLTFIVLGLLCKLKQHSGAVVCPTRGAIEQKKKHWGLVWRRNSSFSYKVLQGKKSIFLDIRFMWHGYDYVSLCIQNTQVRVSFHSHKLAISFFIFPSGVVCILCQRMWRVHSRTAQKIKAYGLQCAAENFCCGVLCTWGEFSQYTNCIPAIRDNQRLVLTIHWLWDKWNWMFGPWGWIWF